MLRSALRALVGTRMVSTSIFVALEGPQTFVTPAVTPLRLKAVNVRTAFFEGLNGQTTFFAYLPCGFLPNDFVFDKK